MSGELMSPGLGRMRAFLARPENAPFVAFFSLRRRGYELRGLRQRGEGASRSSPSSQLFPFWMAVVWTRESTPHWCSGRRFKHANRVMKLMIRDGTSSVLCEDGSTLLGIHNDTARLPALRAGKPPVPLLQMRNLITVQLESCANRHFF